jgi:hypothetical protein
MFEVLASEGSIKRIAPVFLTMHAVYVPVLPGIVA